MSAFRLSNVAAPGSLLKEMLPVRRKLPKVGKDAKYLALIRKLPCVACGKTPVDAAHVRATIVGKPEAGMGNKPDDSWTLPLCRSHHTDGRESQHSMGEKHFYEWIGINPHFVCFQLMNASPDLERMRSIIKTARRP